MVTKDQKNLYQLQKEKAIGYASENRLDEAFDICLDLLQTNPNDPEIARIMGEFFVVARDDQTAEQSYDAEPQDAASKFELEPVEPDEEISLDLIGTGEPVPPSSEAVRDLLQNLTQRVVPVSEAELIQAAEVLQEIVNSPKPAEEVAKRLDEIDSLLPALIDLNIRQARLDGRPDLAAGLAYLKTNINLQKSISQEPLEEKIPTIEKNVLPVKEFFGRVAIFQPDGVRQEEQGRIRLLKSALFARGNLIPDEQSEDCFPDVALFSNPFMEPRLMEKMAALSAAGIPIILDLEYADGQATVSAMTRSKMGVSLQALNKAYASALILADLITVSSPGMYDELSNSGHLVVYIPNGWSNDNPYWGTTTSSTDTAVRLGWFGSSGNLEDLSLIRRPLIRLLREFEHHLRLVIVDDQAAYHMFDHDAEGLVTFLPCVSSNEIPFILDQMDVLMIPTRRTNTIQRQIEDLLMYAGVKKIPWVASPVSDVSEWKEGGMFCSSLEEWHLKLRHLIVEKDLRQTLGMGGFQIAARREMRIHINQWYHVFTMVCDARLQADENLCSPVSLQGEGL